MGEEERKGGQLREREGGREGGRADVYISVSRIITGILAYKNKVDYILFACYC